MPRASAMTGQGDAGGAAKQSAALAPRLQAILLCTQLSQSLFAASHGVGGRRGLAFRRGFGGCTVAGICRRRQVGGRLQRFGAHSFHGPTLCALRRFSAPRRLKMRRRLPARGRRGRPRRGGPQRRRGRWLRAVRQAANCDNPRSRTVRRDSHARHYGPGLAGRLL